MKKIIIGIFTLTTLVGCQEVINLDLNSANPYLVIDATIDDEAAADTVKITKTVGLDQGVSDLRGVVGARVTLSDDAGNSEVLLENSAGKYLTNTMAKGVPGRTYTLAVVAEGKTYTSICKMPIPVHFDTLVTIPSAGFGPPNPNLRVPVPIYRDPIGEKNFYRFIRTIRDTSESNFIIRDDVLTNGLLVRNPVNSFGGKRLLVGDKLKLTMLCIDEAVYNYLRTVNTNSGGGMGASATPQNPISNFEGGCLGYFSAQSAQERTIIAF